MACADVPMPDQFCASSDLLRVVLPGAINFIGFGKKALLTAKQLKRPHYERSSFFTHVTFAFDKIEMVSKKLAW